MSEESPSQKWMRERRQPWRAEGLDVTAACPEHDEVRMTSTGNLFLDPKFGDWYVEYRCPVDGELFTIFATLRQPEIEAVEKHPLT